MSVTQSGLLQVQCLILFLLLGILTLNLGEWRLDSGVESAVRRRQHSAKCQ